MNIILLGAPASGKGTQAQLLAKKLKLFNFKSGDLSRTLASGNERLKKIIDSGELVPEDEMSMYVVDFLARHRPETRDILFEGFPRFISQFEALQKFLLTKGDDIDAVISLDMREEDAIARISSRRVCVKCGQTYNLISNPPKKEGKCDKCGGNLAQRDDDTPKSIKVRFNFYHKNTKELINYLAKKKSLIRVNANKPVEEVFAEIVEGLKHVKKRNNKN